MPMNLFFLSSKSVPARVSLGVTTLLTMSTQTAGVNRSLPPVAYTKVGDMYLFKVLLLTFSNHIKTKVSQKRL